MVNVTRKLTRVDTGSRATFGWVSDVHIGCEHTAALNLMCEAFEWAGVTHFVPGGDILDLHCLSTHPKDPDRILKSGTLDAEIASGRWLLDYFATRPAYYTLGNHEARWHRFVGENALPLFGNDAMSFQRVMRIPEGIEVLPPGSELRLGNLVLSHGDAEFKKSTGGKYPAQKLLDMAPDQSSIVGHLHRINQARRSTADEDGVKRTRAAWTMGHMSREEQHHDYVSRHINWQMGFGVIDVWWDGDRPRWDVTQVEVHLDRRRRPYFGLRGRLFQ